MPTDYSALIAVYKTWGIPIPPSVQSNYRTESKCDKLRSRVAEKWPHTGTATTLKPTYTGYTDHRCYCCGKSKHARKLEYVTAIDAWLCTPCKVRARMATSSGCIDGLSVLVAKQMYNLEAGDTRKANAGFEENSVAEVRCPRCGISKSVQHLFTSDINRESIFFCNECRDDFGYLDGVVAWREGHRFYRINVGDPANRFNVEDVCTDCGISSTLNPHVKFYRGAIADMTQDQHGIKLHFPPIYCEECMKKNRYVRDYERIVKLPF